MKPYSQFGLVTLLAALVAAWLEWGGGPKPGGVLRVGIHPAPGSELIFLAEEKGFYHAENLQVRLVEFTCLSDCRRAYERGLVDVVGSAAVEIPGEPAARPFPAQIVEVRDGATGGETPPGLLGGRPADVAKFLRALHRALDYARQTQPAADRIIAGPAPAPVEAASETTTHEVATTTRRAPTPVAVPGDRLITFIEPAPQSAAARTRAGVSQVAFWQN